MTYIYIYRMTNDTGSAPCIFEKGYNKTDLLSLACCKGGQIRKGKDVETGLRHTIGKRHKDKKDEVYVMGIYKDYVLYAAKISEIISMEEYYSNNNYSNRLDYIYNSKKERNKNNPLFHPEGDGSQLRRDWNGVYVLLSDNFSYNGEGYTEYSAEKIKNFLPVRQETKGYDNNSDGFNTVFDFLSEVIKTGSRNNSVEILKMGCKGCYQK